MRPSPVLIWLAMLPLSACGSSPQQSTTPQDSIMQLNARAGEQALTLERSEAAIAEYRRAFERALARDDAAAIGDYGYDLAVAQLVANQPREALASIRMTRIELARRSAWSFPALDLAEATAEYRLGERDKSDRLAIEIATGSDMATANHAIFLRGLIADEKGDAAGLNEAIVALGQPTAADQQADAAELSARRDIRQGRFEAAIAEAERSIDLRRDALDYRGMARALAVAGDAEARAGDRREAAAFYMRAGQSAAALGDAESAHRWLGRSMSLGSDPGLRDEARIALTRLTRPASHRIGQ